MGKAVPEILLSGHHANIEKWRHEQALERTKRKRPELIKDADLTQKEKDFLNNNIL